MVVAVLRLLVALGVKIPGDTCFRETKAPAAGPDTRKKLVCPTIFYIFHHIQYIKYSLYIPYRFPIKFPIQFPIKFPIEFHINA